MSNRFAEREHRRAKGGPPLDDADAQLDLLDDRLKEMASLARTLTREIRTSRAELAEVRLDLEAAKKGRK